MTIRVMEFPSSARGNDPADFAGDEAYAEELRQRVGAATHDARRAHGDDPGYAPDDDHGPAPVLVHTFGRARAALGFDATFGPIEPEQVPMVIEGLLPQTAFGIVGAGGTWKSTTMLRMMIATILGREVFGHKVERPGPCLFVQAEDDAATIRYRARRLCEAMGLNEADKRTVADNLYIEDATGTICRLVQQGIDGNLTFSPLVADLIREYRDAGVRICAFDPATFFGPGERHVNDGEALLMAAARRISREIGSATGYIHHTGKQAARDRTIDMYAGRGGSAFADNARMVGVMLPYDPADSKFVMPHAISDAISGRRDPDLVLLHVPKLSYGRRPEQPLWILRDSRDPWRFLEAWGESLNSDQRREARREEEAVLRFSVLAAIWDHLTSEDQAGRHPTKNSIRESLRVEVQGAKIGKDRLAELIDFGISRGFFGVREMPPSKVRGAAKNYITARQKPTLGGAR